MAIICCATPSELYLEETRSSLQFCSRAKLVKTRAQVNEVLDDRSLIKKLQRELDDAKRTSGGSHTSSQFETLKTEAANAKRTAEKSEKNLQRLKSSILRGGLFHGFIVSKQRNQISAEGHAITYSSGSTYSNVTSASINSNNAHSPIVGRRKKRRMSDSFIPGKTILMDCTNSSSDPFASPKANISKAKALTNTKVGWSSQRVKLLNGSSEMSLLKEAFNAKAAIARSLQEKIIVCENKMREHDNLMSRASDKIILLKKSNAGFKADVVELVSKRNTLEEEKQRMISTNTILLAERDSKNQNAVNTMEKILADKENTDSMLISLRSQNEDLTFSAEALHQEQDKENKELKKQIKELMLDNKRILQQQHCLEQKNSSLLQENGTLSSDLNNVNKEKATMTFELTRVSTEKEELIKAKGDFDAQVELQSIAFKQLSEELTKSEAMTQTLSVRSSNCSNVGMKNILGRKTATMKTMMKSVRSEMMTIYRTIVSNY